MIVWFTSDMHFGHGNIIRYCDRPFTCAEHMNVSLVRNWNSRVKEGDKVIHIGDFCCKGAERGIAGVKTKAESWEERLNGTVIHVQGNHDPNNSVKLSFSSAILFFSDISWYLVHKPPMEPADIPEGCGAVLCGHVHEKWAHKMVGSIPVINVGVDVRRFMPINKTEVTRIYQRVMKA